jgi:hypothetical protein
MILNADKNATEGIRQLSEKAMRKSVHKKRRKLVV